MEKLIFSHQRNILNLIHSYCKYKFMYEEHEEIYEEFCKHQGWLLNQGVYWCKAGLDYTKCNICSYREPIKHTVKVSCASTEY